MAQIVPAAAFVRDCGSVRGDGSPKEATMSVTGHNFVSDRQHLAPTRKGVRPRP
jgi:hypothetical protein